MPNQPIITSIRNSIYRHCLNLRNNRKRRRTGQFLIDGSAEIVRAIEAGIEVQKLLFSSDRPLDNELEAICQRAPSIELVALLPELLDKLSYGQIEARPIALAVQPEHDLGSLNFKRGSLLLVLDQLEKPGNLGACVRSAVACGCAAVVLTRPLSDPFNPNAIRASRGALFQIPIVTATPEAVVELALRFDLPVFAARIGTDRTLWDLPLTDGAVFVFGNETHGLDDQWRFKSVESFMIPMNERVDSLNLSISAAITLYEAVRQKLLIKI